MGMLVGSVTRRSPPRSSLPPRLNKVAPSPTLTCVRCKPGQEHCWTSKFSQDVCPSRARPTALSSPSCRCYCTSTCPSYRTHCASWPTAICPEAVLIDPLESDSSPTHLRG